MVKYLATRAYSFLFGWKSWLEIGFFWRRENWMDDPIGVVLACWASDIIHGDTSHLDKEEYYDLIVRRLRE